jgi:hypothetical protein
MRTQHFRSIERRRTSRVALCVDLMVHGETESSGKFKAEARTLSVSKHGGMMALEPEVRIGQKLMLININSGQKTECKVVSAKPVRDGKRNVAFEFMSAESNFWKMHFPVAGTKPIRRAVQALFRSVPTTKMAR